LAGEAKPIYEDISLIGALSRGRPQP
jgi:hypothetical protein